LFARTAGTRHQLNFEVPGAARGPCKDLVCRRVPIFLRRSVVPASKVVVSSGGRSEPFRHRRPLGELEGTGFRRIDSDFCNNHSREVGECPQEACSCRDCGHIRIGRGRDNRVPTQAAAWQARPRAPLPRDENPLQSGRDQLGTQPGRRGCPQLLRHPVTSSIGP
jgi:hypothetical protein